MRIEEFVDLADYTTIHIGGQARYRAMVATLDDLRDALALARGRRLPYRILAGGSNVILSDIPFPGLVIHLANVRYSMDTANHRIVAGSGVPMEELVTQTTEKGWQGLEWAGGLPGSVGGAVRGNAGAFGGEIKDVIRGLVTLDPQTFETRLWQPEECDFSYRFSIFKTLPDIIWEVRLQLSSGVREELIESRDEKIRYRLKRHPQEPSAGSIFQNLLVNNLPKNFFTRFPELEERVRDGKLAAGALLEAVGMKGKRSGGAVISRQHANIVVNVGEASFEDVRDLAEQMKAAVVERYGIKLHEEPEFVHW